MPPTEGDDRMKNPTAILILAAAQFVMVLDSSVMNVSISQIVEDLDTTIQGVQLAITAYTLVMAAFMLTGAKLGDIWGRDRMFAIGLVVYATGSLITALSPNLTVLLIGWSLIEGLGAVLVVPAIAALIAANYEGKERALAYGLIGGVAAAAVAVGPIIGGWVTTNYTWRYVFVGEVVIVAVILLVRNRMKKSPRPENPPKLDLVGAALSASGFGLIVLGILQTSSWGWVQPKGALTINGTEITPLGFSVVPFLILGGLGLLADALVVGEPPAGSRRGRPARHVDAVDQDAPGRALDARLAAARPDGHVLRAAGVPAGRARPGRVQHRPEAACRCRSRCSSPRSSGRASPPAGRRGGSPRRRSCCLAIGSVIILGTIDIELNSMCSRSGSRCSASAIGGLASQLGNVIMSSVDPAQTNQAGGLQGTAQNLGASLGTALIGAILLGGLTASFVDRIADNPALTAEQQAAVTDYVTETGLEVIPVPQLEAALVAAGCATRRRGRGRRRLRPVAARRPAQRAVRGGGVRGALGLVHAPAPGRVDRGAGPEPDPAPVAIAAT